MEEGRQPALGKANKRSRHVFGAIDPCDSDLVKGLTTTSISRFLPCPPSITIRPSYLDSRISLFALDWLRSSSTFLVGWGLTGV